MAEQRRRKRNSFSPEKRTEIANRVVDLYNTEWQLRGSERNARLQRYAKYRLWTEGTDWPWPGAADTAIPDMLQDSLRVQDTLHNAVMSQRPPVISRATHKEDEDKQQRIDDLIQYQLFVEQAGEKIIGELAESFVNDPACTAFIPWVREKRKVADIQVFPEIPDDQSPKDYFFAIVRQAFPQARRFDATNAGWGWIVTDQKDEETEVSFYTNEADEIEMVREKDAIVYDGPLVIVKDFEDVLFPARSGNLQPPSPSNPSGAAYVILRDFPVLSEVKRLQKSGYYDLLIPEELAKLEIAAGSPQNENQAATQKDALSGAREQPGKPKDPAHGRKTRLICFDTYDIDGDGIDEDVIFWVILETKTLVKARLLSDMYPGNPPRRPFAGDSFLPVNGRYAGMSQLEIMEAMHDAVKVLVDQSINSNDLAIASPGYYRPSGGMNPEVLKIEPFTLVPLQNPQQDIAFPPIGNPNAMGFSLNMLNILSGWQDRLTMVSDLQGGAIPPGSSSALRTIGTMSLVMGQGEARPERLLRRFFMILTDIYRQIHRLNQSFLPKNKQFRISGYAQPGQDPYRKIANAAEISGDFQFTFDANVLNTSKAALQQSLEGLMRVFINPLMIQLGVVKPDNIYRMCRDYAMSKGQPPERYLNAPTPQAAGPQILSEEAITSIMLTQMPVGTALEPGGPAEHLQKLIAFANSVEFAMLNEGQVDLFRQYLSQVRDAAAQQQQAAQVQSQAQQFSQMQNQGGQGGAPTQNMPQQPQAPMVSGPNEMMNETLPTAGGGANNP